MPCADIVSESDGCTIEPHEEDAILPEFVELTAEPVSDPEPAPEPSSEPELDPEPSGDPEPEPAPEPECEA